MRRFRIASAMILALGLGLVGSSGVLAKSGDVVATFDAPLPVDPTPGATVRIGWTLTIRFDDGSVHPFLAEGVFLRLSPVGATPVEFPADSDRDGHFVASVTVPSGGLGTLAIGLQGLACRANSACTRADELFRIAPKPASAAAPAGGAGGPAAQAPQAPAAAGGGAPAPVVGEAAPAVQPSAVAAPRAPAPEPMATGAPDLAPVALVLIVAAALVATTVALRGRGRPAAARGPG